MREEMTAALMLVGVALAGLTVGIGLIMANSTTTPEETQKAGNTGVIVFAALLVVAAISGVAVFGLG